MTFRDLSPSGVDKSFYFIYKHNDWIWDFADWFCTSYHKCFCDNWYKINHQSINLWHRLVFNIISKDLSSNQVDRIKKLLNFYHRLSVCYEWKYKRFKKILLFLNMTSISFTIVDTSLPPITHYTSLSTSSCGVCIQVYISDKIQRCKFTYHSNQVLYDEKISDLCPPINGMSKRYDKLWQKKFNWMIWITSEMKTKKLMKLKMKQTFEEP